MSGPFRTPCAKYSSLLRTQVSSYRNQRNAVFGNIQARGEYLGGYRARVGEGAQAVHVDEADSDEGRGVPPLIPRMKVILLRSLLRSSPYSLFCSFSCQ